MPEQQTGKAIDAESSIELNGRKCSADNFFMKAKNRLAKR